MALSIRTSIWMLVALSVFGCGYRFAGSGPMPGDIQSIAVAIPENRSAESGLEVILADELVRVFKQRSAVSVVDTDAADASVAAVIQAVPVSAISRSAANLTTQQRVSVIVDIRLIGANGRTLWTRNQVGDSETYAVGNSRADTDLARRVALEVVVARLADKLYRAMTDDF